MVKILIVDDEPDILFILKNALKKEGYDIVEMTSGNECLLKIEEIKPDLVILDIMMPDIDGWEVCKRIKESFKDIPVSMLSVRKSEDSIEKSLKYANADRHLTKPIKIEEVRRTVKQLVAIQARDN
ncbi:MAG: response regulator transcription factor [Candidatus Hydrothermarchaeales archaeon]